MGVYTAGSNQWEGWAGGSEIWDLKKAAEGAADGGVGPEDWGKRNPS